MNGTGFPLPQWMRDYPKGQLGTDVSAGLIVAVLVIPQSLAYAPLAGLPPQAHLPTLADGAGTRVHDLVLVMSAVNRMDATSVEVFCELNEDLADRSVRLHLAEVKGPVQDRLMRSPLWSDLSGAVFLSANEAFEKLR